MILVYSVKSHCVLKMRK